MAMVPAPTLPELVLKCYQPLYEELQRVAPAGSSSDEAADLLHLVMDFRPALERAWKRTLADLRTGMGDKAARSRVEVMVSLSRVATGAIRLVLKACSNAEESLLVEARCVLSEAQEIQTSVHELQEIISRCPAPVNPEDIDRAKGEWQRGEGMEAEAMIAMRANRRPA